jgi:hypothetical protein
MNKLNIQLPKDIQQAPAEVREQILVTLRQAMELPKVMNVIAGRGDEHNMWERNGDELLGQAEDGLYEELQEASAQRMADIFAALGLNVDDLDTEKAFTLEYETYVDDLTKSKQGWMGNAKRRISDLVAVSKERRESFVKYIQDTNPFKKAELAKIDKMLRSRLPDYAKTVEAYMVRAGFIGKIRNESEKQVISTIGAMVDRFPESIQASRRESVVLTEREAREKASEGHKVTILPLTPREAAAVSHATHGAADKVQEVDDRHRAGIKQLIIRAKKERWLPKRLEQELFDLYGEQNRDWRRVAITELAMVASDAYLSELEDGEQVIGMGSVDACKHCKEMVIGKQFTVLREPPSEESEASGAQMVWPGKTNFGRRVATYRPCIPMHPLCRCRWHRISRFYKMVEGVPTLKSASELIQEERAKRGLPPDPNL